ncbi:hypothetical protein FA95DRAFT_762144 [Auriscalpium vulgare]|uniref:Uncharacterized protein n=1 Tax=Auriscalpium vulgare TaxID=40419 RepID=A0ACB8S0R5_9AGAM|nr:hypothetical protein FA95DRAFT_762144 [Auriscalpium vulgare]
MRSRPRFDFPVSALAPARPCREAPQLAVQAYIHVCWRHRAGIRLGCTARRRPCLRSKAPPAVRRCSRVPASNSLPAVPCREDPASSTRAYIQQVNSAPSMISVAVGHGRRQQLTSPPRHTQHIQRSVAMSVSVTFGSMRSRHHFSESLSGPVWRPPGRTAACRVQELIIIQQASASDRDSAPASSDSHTHTV